MRRDIDKLARVMFLLLCHITSIAKQIVFYGKAIKIDEMVGTFDGTYLIKVDLWGVYIKVHANRWKRCDKHGMTRYRLPLSEPLFNQSLESHKVLMRATTASANRFVAVYSGCAVVTCTLWIIFPVMYHLRAQPVEFPFWTNVDYNQSQTMSVYLLILLTVFINIV